MASTDNINSAQALINIATLCRNIEPAMPTETLIAQRTTNKDDVTENLKQSNSYTILPELSQFDDYIENINIKPNFALL